MDDIAWQMGPFLFTPTQAVIRGVTSVEEWQAPLDRALRMQRSSPWWIGDMLVYGESQYGDEIWQSVHDTASFDMLQRFMAVSKAIPPSRRNSNLSWSHHREVMKLAPALQVVCLRKAEAEGWNTQELRKYVQQNWKNAAIR